jgi:hypothetical protein
MFVTIALLSIPMGLVAYQLNWIRQRHAAIDSQAENNFAVFVGPGHGGHFSVPEATVPWQLRIFGEQGAGGILVINGERTAGTNAKAREIIS